MLFGTEDNLDLKSIKDQFETLVLSVGSVQKDVITIRAAFLDRIACLEELTGVSNIQGSEEEGQGYQPDSQQDQQYKGEFYMILYL